MYAAAKNDTVRSVRVKKNSKAAGQKSKQCAERHLKSL